MKNPNPNMLLKIAQADSYAAATEFLKLTRDEDLEVYEQALKYEKYCKHPRHNLSAGKYTDDTQMSIGIAEVLLQTQEPGLKQYADAWVRCFQRDQRDGYARGFQKFLETNKTADDFLKNIRSRSEKNGAAMRSVPIGVLPDVNSVCVVAESQASVTHDTVIGRYASVAVALLSHWALHVAEPAQDEGDGGWWNGYGFVLHYLPKEYKSLWEEVASFAWDGSVHSATDTVHAVFQSLVSSSSLMEVLDKIIRWQGDTDSVAAIAWGIGSSCPFFLEDDAPDWMYYCLEPGGKYGPEFLKDLGSQLMDKYSKGE